MEEGLRELSRIAVKLINFPITTMPLPSSSTPDPPFTAATTITPRLFPNPPPPQRPQTQIPLHHRHPTYRPPSHPHQQPIYSAQSFPTIAPRAHPVPYPVASSGRGFLHRPIRPDHSVAAARPVGPYPHHNPARPYGFPLSDPQGSNNVQLIRPATTHLHHSLVGSPAGVAPAVVKGIPVSTQHHTKVAPSPSLLSDSNGYKDTWYVWLWGILISLLCTVFRDISRDDNLVTVRDRKVRISDNASLYALCRSWLRNGFPEESQCILPVGDQSKRILPHYADAVKSLPRPLPVTARNAHSPIQEGDKEEEDEGLVKDLSPKELLQRHVKRAKRIRARYVQLFKHPVYL
ncbi:hypothetical protein RJ639_017894 [Escallonia herrerae]|uniref:Uncharacterized protein n=1 Tax=Escallonia herrerae TaxID=1293975 RepID=A0AA89AJ20_9ASTE|nr:hypothetical protein RJ639_017894 [Escallonia herrerae]